MPSDKSRLTQAEHRAERSAPSQAQRKYRVMLVDDHPIIREGLRSLLRETEFEVCAEAETVSEAKALLRQVEPDVLVLDLTLGQGDGLELVRDVRVRYPRVRILVLSMRDESVYALRLIGAGASGYLMKESAANQFAIALRRVCAGQTYLSDAATAQMLDRMANVAHPGKSPVDELSDRELQVLHLLGQGKSTREIGADLNLSIKTVESHRRSMKRKLSLKTSAQLVQFAVNWSAGNSVRKT